MIGVSARGCCCGCCWSRHSCWDEQTPCDHYLKRYAAAVGVVAQPSPPDSTDPYTYCHRRTHFLCTAAHCGASRTSPDTDGSPYCVFVCLCVYWFYFVKRFSVVQQIQTVATHRVRG